MKRTLILLALAALACGCLTVSESEKEPVEITPDDIEQIFDDEPAVGEDVLIAVDAYFDNLPEDDMSPAEDPAYKNIRVTVTTAEVSEEEYASLGAAIYYKTSDAAAIIEAGELTSNGLNIVAVDRDIAVRINAAYSKTVEKRKSTQFMVVLNGYRAEFSAIARIPRASVLFYGRLGGVTYTGTQIDMRDIRNVLYILPRYEKGIITLAIAAEFGFIDASNREQVISLSATVALVDNGTVVLARGESQSIYSIGDFFLTGRSGRAKTKRIIIVNARTIN